MNKTLNYIQSITALLIIRYYILVAEVDSCLSSAGNTVATEFFAGMIITNNNLILPILAVPQSITGL